MARHANLSIGKKEDEEAEDSSETTRNTNRPLNLDSLSPSPAASFSSDKENRQAQVDETLHDFTTAKNTSPSRVPMSSYANDDLPRSSKKRKLGERNATNASQTAHERQLAGVGDRRFYDPDQSMDERRAVRKDLRDLSRELTGI